MVTKGKGWYQEEEKEPQKLKVGDIVNIPVGVKHWHGATKGGNNKMLKKIKVLIADDNIHICKFIRNYLENFEF